VCGVAVACEVYEVDTEPACEPRRRSPTAHAGVVVDGDAVPEGEIDAHHDTRIVAEGVLGVGGQAGAVGYGTAVCLALDDRDQVLVQHPAAVGHSQLAAAGVADDARAAIERLVLRLDATLGPLVLPRRRPPTPR
jgi:hypothetical protein